MKKVLISLRGLLWCRLKVLRDARYNEVDGLKTLLAHLAVTDLALCRALYAMEMVPELQSDRDLRRLCITTERGVFFVWSKLGLYAKATAWARRGLATIVARTLSHGNFQPAGHAGPAEVNDTYASGKLYICLCRLLCLYVSYAAFVARERERE